jgi:type II secretory pathway component GspD/PulD (secretin)
MGPQEYIDLVQSVMVAYGRAEVPMETRVFRLQNAQAVALVDLVQTLANVNGHAEVAMDSRTNALIVSAAPSRMTEVMDLISRLDIPVDQADNKKPSNTSSGAAKPAP